ncbi:hypothetical protein TNCT_393321 [Trichonephila clavata]|uniref:Uncharacterized protein n=1 Tax=Trichonephila clavata TaxID=2740835 RepID=A0A8X6GFM5_TRICU|nr:hypothetical protein TNCT_393321 [Trichonephila clavata]
MSTNIIPNINILLDKGNLSEFFQSEYWFAHFKNFESLVMDPGRLIESRLCVGSKVWRHLDRLIATFIILGPSDFAKNNHSAKATFTNAFAP